MDHNCVLVLQEIGKLRNRTDWSDVWSDEIRAVGDIGNRVLIWQLPLELVQPCTSALAMCKYHKTIQAWLLLSKLRSLWQFWLKKFFIYSFLCNLFHWGNLVVILKSGILCAFLLSQGKIKWLMVTTKWIPSAWVKLMGAQLLHH